MSVKTVLRQSYLKVSTRETGDNLDKLLILKGPIWIFFGGAQQPFTRLWLGW